MSAANWEASPFPPSPPRRLWSSWLAAVDQHPMISSSRCPSRFEYRSPCSRSTWDADSIIVNVAVAASGMALGELFAFLHIRPLLLHRPYLTKAYRGNTRQLPCSCRESRYHRCFPLSAPHYLFDSFGINVSTSDRVVTQRHPSSHFLRYHSPDTRLKFQSLCI